MRILITAFEPFGEIRSNCTEMILKEIKNIKNVDTLLLAVESEVAFLKLQEHLEKVVYDYVILLGQAAGRSRVSLERIAINVNDFPIEDNAGTKLIDQEIIPGQDAGLFSTLPLREIYEHLRDHNIDCEISNSAGTYVCNEVFFKALSFTQNMQTKLGFIHFPLIKEQNCRMSTTHWSLSDHCLALKVIIKLVSNS